MAVMHAQKKTSSLGSLLLTVSATCALLRLGKSLMLKQFNADSSRHWTVINWLFAMSEGFNQFLHLVMSYLVQQQDTIAASSMIVLIAFFDLWCNFVSLYLIPNCECHAYHL